MKQEKIQQNQNQNNQQIVVYLKVLNNFPVVLKFDEKNNIMVEYVGSTKYSQQEIMDQINKLLKDMEKEDANF